MKKLLTVVFFLLLIAYLGINIYSGFVNGVKTETLVTYTDYDKISCDGVLVRDEKVMLNETDGVIDYAIKDGEKVAKNSVIASVYAKTEDIQKRNRIKQIEDMIDDLEYAQSPSGLLVSDPAVIEDLIKEDLEGITENVKEGNPYAVYDIKNDLLLLSNRKKLSLGQVSNFNDEISVLTQEKEMLQSNLSSKTTDIYTPLSGCFLSETDGYETLFSLDSISTMSVEELDAIISAKTEKNLSENTVGKIITDFNWCFITVMDSSIQEKLYEGKNVTVSFPFASGRNITMQVESIKTDLDDPSKCAVTFESNIMINELNLTRFLTADLIFDTYQGIRIPSSAIRIVDGKKGVYVLIGTQAKFKEVNIIYEQPDYAIIEQKDPIFERVMPVTPGDEVITGAKELYNGKIVK